MSIYNYTVLKSNPIKLTLPVLFNQDLMWAEMPVYRIKWHGRDYMMDYNAKEPFYKPFRHVSKIDVLKERADHAWGADSPAYSFDTGAVYDGREGEDQRYQLYDYEQDPGLVVGVGAGQRKGLDF